MKTSFRWIVGALAIPVLAVFAAPAAGASEPSSATRVPALAAQPARVALAAQPARVALAAQPAPVSPSVFVQTNSPNGNQIDVFARGSDGRLSATGTYDTGGLGGVESGAMVDSLASQNSLVYDGSSRQLYAVNAGTDTISVFDVVGGALRRVEVISSGGEFPVSIATWGRLVYVLNAGGSGSVQGFIRLSGQLYPLGRAVSLGLDNTNPPNFLMGPGDIGLSPDGTKLIVTTKASTSEIDVFGVGRFGKLSAPVMNASATPVPFAFTWAPNDTLVVAEAGSSEVSTYTVNADGTLSHESSLADGQTALCWITEAQGFDFVANAGSADLSAYKVGPGGSLSLVGTSGVVASTGAGPIDIAATPGGRYVYSEDGGADAVYEFGVNPDGSLTAIGTVEGLTPGLEGIAAD